MDRYNTEYYQRRITNNRRIKQHLIDKICEHGRDLAIDRLDLQWLNYEDLLELAVPTVNKTLTITLGQGQDWDNGKDAKVSIARSHNGGLSYTAGITGCSDKTHIQALVYEARKDKFYYFDFPVQKNAKGLPMTEHSIPFDLDGTPKRQTRLGANKMWQYECESFEAMCLGIRNNCEAEAQEF